MNIRPTGTLRQEISVPSSEGSVAVLVIILVSYLMIVLDISIVITALPKIQQDLGFSVTDLSWVQNAYTLAFGGLLLLGARAGDILGRRLMFMAGLALFTLSSLSVGVAQSAAWLLVARAIQGVGAAILAPSTLALLTASFPAGRERTRAVASYGAVAGIGASLGLVLGGIVTSWFSWRLGFFINIPIGMVMLLAAPHYLPESERQAGQFDVLGALSSFLGMTVFVYGIVRSADVGWANPLTILSLSIGLLLLGFLVLNEWRAKQPIMPLRLFANRERAGAYIARILYLGAMLGFWFFITQYLQIVKGYSPVEAGIAFLPMTIFNFIVAVLVPRLTRRFGNARLLASGVVVTLIGMAWLSRLTADGSYVTSVALPMVLLGIGQGASLGPLTAAGIAEVTPKDAGAASGLVNIAHQLGGSLGLGILVTVFAAASSSALLGNTLLTHRVSVALTAGAIMLALAFIVVVVLIVRPFPAGKSSE